MPDLITRRKFGAAVDRDAVAADWRARGYSCHQFRDPPGRQWNDFVHGCNEVVTVVTGRLAMIVDGERVEMGVGDEVFIPARAVHSVHNLHAGETIWLFGYD